MKNKLNIFICISILIIGNSNAQPFKEPQFKFTLYVHDALGFRDSVILGMDSILTATYIHPDFGEVDITDIPFTNPLEIRGSEYGGNEFHSKIKIQPYYLCSDKFSSYNFTTYMGVSLRVKNFPITLSWDKEKIKNSCPNWLHFTRHWLFTHHPWPPSVFPQPILRLSEQDSFTFDKKYLDITNDYKNAYIANIDSGATDSIYVFFLGWAKNMPVDAVVNIQDISLNSSPNPTNRLITITLPKNIENIESIVIENIGGKKAKEIIRPELFNDSEIHLDFSDLIPNLYIVKVRNKKNEIYWARIVRI